MRFANGFVTSCFVAAATIVSAQDERLPVVRPQVETVKVLPTPFPFADKKAADYDLWIRTPWVQMNRAKCGRECVQVSLITGRGLVQIDTAGARNGFAKLRLGLTIPPSCADYAWYGEMKDQFAGGAGTTDPSLNPVDLSRIHVFRFDEQGREISMVFQNEHLTNARQARLNVLCKSK